MGKLNVNISESPHGRVVFEITFPPAGEIILRMWPEEARMLAAQLTAVAHAAERKRNGLG